MNIDTCLALRTEIEVTREQYHRWLVVIPENKLSLPSHDPNWTNGEVLYRISVSPLYIPSILTRNFGGSASPLHQKLFTGSLMEWGNEQWTRVAAQNLTLMLAAQDYESNCQLVLDILDRFSEDDLGMKVRIPQPDSLLTSQVTIEELFHYVKNYFSLYRKDVNLNT